MSKQINELPPLASTLEPIQAGLEDIDNDVEVVLLSDFDYTLCNSYGFNAQTNNHLPKIDPSTIEAAKKHRLLVATGRRANTAAISLLWESGLVSPTMPIITENGGTIAERDAEGVVIYRDLVPEKELTTLGQLQSQAAGLLPPLPHGQKLIWKTGRTMQLARLQDSQGNIEPVHQAWLAEQLQGIITSGDLSVVDTRVSVSIQHKSVDKGTAFRRYLHEQNSNRENMFVIGMGDGKNDRELFENADFSIGLSEAVRDMVDVYVPHGADVMPDILRFISSGLARAKRAKGAM